MFTKRESFAAQDKDQSLELPSIHSFSVSTLDDKNVRGPEHQKMEVTSASTCCMMLQHLDDMSRIGALYGVGLGGYLCFVASDSDCVRGPHPLNQSKASSCLEYTAVASGIPTGIVGYVTGCTLGLFSAPVVAYRGKKFQCVTDKREELGLSKK